jgi:ABC-type dipeptide/oligopeptide/nickel transport system permease component
LSVSAFLTLVGLILSDILYAVTDPRISFERTES